MTLEQPLDNELTPAEMEKLKSFDSTLYGQIDLFNTADGSAKRLLLVKGAQSLENELIRSTKLNTPPSSTLLCSLGHIQLLLEDFPKAMSAYQKYYNMDQTCEQNINFLYGLGIVYSHFNQDQWAMQTFQQVLYLNPTFVRASDVHFRIGIIRKNNKEYETATKHFRIALNDSSSSAFLKAEVRFHGAHMFELQGDNKQAKLLYEQLLQGTSVPDQIRANAYRQLGWMYHSDESFGDLERRELTAIEYLRKSIDADNTNGQSWYYLGRCYSTLNKVHDAFVSYRQSIDKSEASADTWCSIGILYQQQNQPMDALQAYICAVQLEKTHTAAWTNLGLLYEANSQPQDALACFQNARNTNPDSVNPNVTSRITVLSTQLSKLNTQQLKEVIMAQKHTLPCINEAFHLPIPAELTSRQQGGVVGGAPPQGYNACSAGLSPGASMLSNGQPSPKKRRTVNRKKAEPKPGDVAQFMNQQMQLPAYLQPQNAASLTPQQQAAAHQMRQQFFAQQQYQISLNMQPEDVPDTSIERQPVYPKDDPAKVLHPSELSAIKQEVVTPAYPVISPRPSQRQSNKLNQNETKTCIAMTAREILDKCKDQSKEPIKGSPNILSDKCRPPLPPPCPEPPLSPEQLTPSTPTITIECKKDAMSSDLQRISMGQPIVLVKNLATVLRMNLGLFSTKTLVETAPDHPCEVRTQRLFNVEETLDAQGQKTWKQESTRTTTTIAKYAHYQASSFQESLAAETGKSKEQFQKSLAKSSAAPQPTQVKTVSTTSATQVKGGVSRDSDSDSSSSSSGGKKKSKMIKFGTNVDLSDRHKWKDQLVELHKLPKWLNVTWAGNGLSHLGHTVLGMNSVQLYMKIPGCRTPAHQENLNLCSVNFNIGPGDCEWFAIPDQYWGELYRLCQKNNVDYLSGAYWPLPEDLFKAKIPLYRFTQKPGDMVFISPGAPHWVQATGWCNNIAWNTAPLDVDVFKLAIERYEFNKLQSYKSIVPMVHLCWNLAKNVKLKDEALHSLIKYVCMKSLQHTGRIENLMSSKGKHIVWHGRQDEDAPHYCFSCELEVFNILFVREVEKQHVVYCIDCALKISPILDGFVILREHLTDSLSQTYDSYELQSESAVSEVVHSLLTFNPQPSTPQAVH